MTQEKREVFTAAELAKLFGVNQKTIYLNAKRGNIPTIKLGRRLFFPKRAIFSWLKTAHWPNFNPHQLEKTSATKTFDRPLPLAFKN